MVGDAVLHGRHEARGRDRARPAGRRWPPSLSSRVRPRGSVDRGCPSVAGPPVEVTDGVLGPGVISMRRACHDRRSTWRFFADDGPASSASSTSWRAARVAAEYQGGHHADRRQRAQDSAKLHAHATRGGRSRDLGRDLRHLGRRVTPAHQARPPAPGHDLSVSLAAIRSVEWSLPGHPDAAKAAESVHSTSDPPEAVPRTDGNRPPRYAAGLSFAVACRSAALASAAVTACSKAATARP